MRTVGFSDEIVMKMKLFSRRQDVALQQIYKRLPDVESTYDSVLDADAAETRERLMRLRFGTIESR